MAEGYVGVDVVSEALGGFVPQGLHDLFLASAALCQRLERDVASPFRKE